MLACLRQKVSTLFASDTPKVGWLEPPSYVGISLHEEGGLRMIQKFPVPCLMTIQEFVLIIGLYVYRTLAVKICYRQNYRDVPLAQFDQNMLVSDLIGNNGMPYFTMKQLTNKRKIICKLPADSALAVMKLEELSFQEQMAYLVKQLSANGIPSAGIQQLARAIDIGCFNPNYVRDGFVVL